MSLINEALKKAQRLRTEGNAADLAPTPGGRIVKRKQPQSAQTMLVIGAGAVVLVVLSVVITVWLLNQPSAPTTPTAAVAAPKSTAVAPSIPATASTAPTAAAATKPAALDEQNAPAVSLAKNTPTTPTPVPPADKPTATTSDAATSVRPAAAIESPAPEIRAQLGVSQSAPSSSNPPTSTSPASAQSQAGVATAPATAPAPTQAVAPTAPAPVVVKPDERVTAFVESLRVSGIRSSGNDSRVLMNDRVYRVNDIVERNLGVRLIKVAVDRLTFADANGVLYVKQF